MVLAIEALRVFMAVSVKPVIFIIAAYRVVISRHEVGWMNNKLQNLDTIEAEFLSLQRVTEVSDSINHRRRRSDNTVGEFA